MLDGHNRYKICTENNRQFSTVNIKLDSLEHAKLWILQHQAGRRNLTDDQRAIIWNDIREQRSKIASAEGAAKARATRTDVSADSVKVTETEKSEKKDTRAEIAREARIPESKIQRAQQLKKHQPELYEKVRNGILKMRDTSDLLPKRKQKIEVKNDFYRHLGHLLDGTFKGTIKDRLEALLAKKDLTQRDIKSIREIADILDSVSEKAFEYAAALRKVCKARVA